MLAFAAHDDCCRCRSPRQFLEALLDTGMLPQASDLVRVGGRSKSERLEAHNLRALGMSEAGAARTRAQKKLLSTPWKAFARWT